METRGKERPRAKKIEMLNVVEKTKEARKSNG